MQSSYAQRYAELYNKHWWWRARERFVIEQIERYHPGRDGHILDIGCGDGLFFPQLSSYGTVEGVEADAEIVSPDGPYFNQIYRGPFDRSFQPARRYSLIVALDVLEHLPDPIGALEHALDLLEDDGSIIITVPAFVQLWTHHDDLNHHYTRYSKSSFRELAANAGFDVQELKYFYHWLFPMKLGVRAKERLIGKSDEGPSIPSPVINEICYQWSRFEQFLPTRCNLPFGSSLLAVGGKRQVIVKRFNETRELVGVHGWL